MSLLSNEENPIKRAHISDYDKFNENHTLKSVKDPIWKSTCCLTRAIFSGFQVPSYIANIPFECWYLIVELCREQFYIDYADNYPLCYFETPDMIEEEYALKKEVKEEYGKNCEVGLQDQLYTIFHHRVHIYESLRKDPILFTKVAFVGKQKCSSKAICTTCLVWAIRVLNINQAVYFPLFEIGYFNYRTRRAALPEDSKFNYTILDWCSLWKEETAVDWHIRWKLRPE
jgi:hypothetical protein